MEALIIQFHSDLNKALINAQRSNSSVVDKFESLSGLGKSTLYKYQSNKKTIPPVKTIEKFYEFIYDGKYRFSELPLLVQQYILENKSYNPKNELPDSVCAEANSVLKLSHVHRVIYLQTIDSKRFAPTIHSIISEHGLSGKKALEDLESVGLIKIYNEAVVRGKKRADYSDTKLVKNLIHDMVFEIDGFSKETGSDKFLASCWHYRAVTLTEEEVEEVNRDIEILNQKIMNMAEKSNGRKILSLAFLTNVINK